MGETKDTKKNTTSPKNKTPKKSNISTNTTAKERISTESTVHEIDAFSVISLILGFASLITWLYPILGVSVAIPGLSIGIVSHETRRSNYALLGIVTSLVGIVLSIVKTFSM